MIFGVHKAMILWSGLVTRQEVKLTETQFQAKYIANLASKTRTVHLQSARQKRVNDLNVSTVCRLLYGRKLACLICFLLRRSKMKLLPPPRIALF